MTVQARNVRASANATSSRKVLAAMAYRREDFKDKVEEHLGGALLEFYKARLARKNGETKWVVHWNTEVRNLVERSFVAALLHRIRGFSDRRRALNEVIASMREDDASYRRAAANIVKRDFGLTKLKVGLTDADTDGFWALVDAAAESVLGGPG
jgi:PAS domain-containing protein